MFDEGLMDELTRVASAVAAAPAALATSRQNRDALRAIQKAQDVLDAAKAQHLAVMADTAAYEDDGSSTLATWARNELRIDGREAKALVAAGRTVALLPQVGEAAASGAIRIEHVKKFSAALRSVGYRYVRDAQGWLLDVATTCSPGELGQSGRARRGAAQSARRSSR